MADENIDIRVRLQGGKVVATEARAVASSVDAIGDSAQRSGTRLSGFQRVGKRLGPALYGIGQATKTAGLYLGGFAAAAAGFATFTGLKFNATMEQNTVAFKHFLGSAGKAESYLKGLYKLAATTPFEFEGLVSGARRFLAFGFQAKEAKEILKEVGDTAAGLGGGTEQIERMVMAIGQMKAKGRIQTEELLQLAELGVPVFSYLQKGLKMSGEQLQSELQKGQVGFKEGLKAIRAGMRRDFGGMSKEQAKTFSGQLSTLKDNTVQMLGELTKPVFDWLRDKGLPAISKALPGIQKWIKGAVAKLPAVFHAVAGAVGDFIDALKPAAPLWENVLWPLIKGFGIGLIGAVVASIKVAIPVFKVLMIALGALGKIMAPFKGLFQTLGTVIGFLFAGPILRAIGALGKFGGIFRVIGTIAEAASIPIRLAGRAFLFVGGTLFKLWLRFTPVGVFIRKLPSILKFAAGAFGTFAGIALGAVGHLVGSVLHLFGGLVDKMVNVGKTIWHALAHGIMSAVGSGLGFAGELGKAVANAAIGFLNEAIPNKIPVPMAPDINLPDNPIPHLARGGITRSAGAVLVGDAGPEILRLPRGARVDPLPRLSMAGVGGGDHVIHHTTIVQLDGREVGRSVERYAADKQNRR